MCFIGIDPGKSGGIAVNFGSSVALTWKIPESETDIWMVFNQEILSLDPKPRFAIIERVASSPGMGCVSAFTFGKGYGFLRACLIGNRIPFSEVSPAVWQRRLGCLTKGNKNISKAKAQQLFPGIKVTHNIADALLISEYCRMERANEY